MSGRASQSKCPFLTPTFGGRMRKLRPPGGRKTAKGLSPAGREPDVLGPLQSVCRSPVQVPKAAGSTACHKGLDGSSLEAGLGPHWPELGAAGQGTLPTYHTTGPGYVRSGGTELGDSLGPHLALSPKGINLAVYQTLGQALPPSGVAEPPDYSVTVEREPRATIPKRCNLPTSASPHLENY